MNALKINPLDNVIVALKDIAAGTLLDIAGESVAPLENIPRGHKIALCDIKAGENIIKYGAPIGRAKADIKKGEWVHTRNVKTNLDSEFEYTYNPNIAFTAQHEQDFFKGFRRGDGKAGIRNEVWIIPTVGCVNSIAQIIEKKSQHLVDGSLEGIYSFTHPYGCSQMSEDHVNTQKALAGLVKHPNAAAVLVLALGCENNTVEQFKAVLGEYDANRVKFLVAQDCEDEISAGAQIIEELAAYAKGFKREDIPMSELIVGLKCGGSDGLSGITANPLEGVLSDMLIAQGGSAILTEVPEMFGAETLLMNRCVNEEVFGKTVALINSFKDYFTSHNQVVYENPSPGNKEGGITTLEDKSLGCTQKGGSAPVVDVLLYGDSVKTKGLNLLEAPGNDLVASTALAVSGAHMVLFSTGRGTPFGSPVPTVKISSNSNIYNHKKEWIDFDAGRLVTGSTMDEISQEFYQYVKRLASGEVVTKAEQYGIRDIAIFKSGVTL